MKNLRKGLKIAILTMATVTFTAGFATTDVEAATSPKLSKTAATVMVGKTNTLKATLNGKAVTKVTWSTSNKAIATVSAKGVVSGKKAGTVSIKAKVSGKTLTCKVTIANPKMNKTSASINVNKTTTLKATLNGAAVANTTWSTSNKTIATVTSKGVVTGKKAGSATITANVNGKAVTCKVTVKNPVTVTAAPKLDKTALALKVGNTSTLKATVNGSTTSNVTWTTSNKSIATVTTNGIVKGITAGNAKITAKVNGKAVDCTVTVTKTTSAIETTAKANMTNYQQFMNDVVKYTNEYRAKNGRKAVTMDNTLALVASYRSVEMAQKDVLSHTRPDGSKFYDLAKKYGVSYTFIGENIGAYQMNAKEVVDAWYNSAGHRANMLSANYTKIGVGVGVTSDGYYYWTQIFKG